jgi:hypothetical protein
MLRTAAGQYHGEELRQVIAHILEVNAVTKQDKNRRAAFLDKSKGLTDAKELHKLAIEFGVQFI